MKKLICALLALAMIFSLVACGNNTDKDNDPKETSSADNSNKDYAEQVQDAADEAAKESGVLKLSDLKSESNIDTTRKSTANTDELHEEITVLTTNEITSFTPWQGGRGRSEVILEIWEPLYYYNDNFELEACIAKSMEWKDDEHLVVEIYDYVKDIDGNPLTAEDVVFSYNTFIEQGNKLDFYKGVEAIGDSTVQFTFDPMIKEDVDALPTVLMTMLFTEKAYNDHDFATDPVGTGAYYLESLVEGNSYHFLMNENYWQTDEAARCSQAGQNLKGWTTKVINDNSVAYMAFQSGEIFNYTMSATDLPDILAGGQYEGKYVAAYEYMTGRYGVEFNMSGRSVCDDLNLRLAICYAIDGEGIVAAMGENSYYQCHAESGIGNGGYQEVWDTTYKDSYYGIYDPNLAMDYLKKSDYDGEELVFVSLAKADQQQACQIIVEQLKAIGIKASYVSIEQALLSSYLYDLDAYDMFFFNWNGTPIGQQWQRQMDYTAYAKSNTHDGIAYNEFGCHDETLQGYIEDVQLVSKATDELIQEVQQYIQDNAMMYALYSTISYTVYQPEMARLISTNGHKDVMWGACEYYLD